MKSFKQYITEETKEIVFTFGRLNPPTLGHLKLLDALKSMRTNYRVYISQSHDAKKNPLTYEQKVKYARKMFPTHARNIILDKKIKTVMDALSSLYSQGFTKVTMVVGSDRVAEFKALANRYNNVKGRHGFYNFEGGVRIVSAGERDPDADDVTGMSASKLRAAAASNDYSTFAKGLPPRFKEGKELFNDVRKGLGLDESYQFREHIEFRPVSEEREAYVAGDLFSVGDEVVIKETEEVAVVRRCGANFVIIESGDKQLRKWITDIEKL